MMLAQRVGCIFRHAAISLVILLASAFRHTLHGSRLEFYVSYATLTSRRRHRAHARYDGCATDFRMPARAIAY